MRSKDVSDAGSTRDKIRTAAIATVGELGSHGATVRAIAARAEVPIGLVSYHFGSKEGLLEACDEWLIQQTVAEKDYLTDAHRRINPMQLMADDSHMQLVVDYFVQRMRGGGKAAERLFDIMTRTTEQILSVGMDAGTIRPMSDLTATSAVLVAYSAGALAYATDIARQLGGTDLLRGEVLSRYSRAALDLLTNGMFAANPFDFDAADASVSALNSLNTPDSPKES